MARVRQKKLLDAQTVTATTQGTPVGGFAGKKRLQSVVVAASVGGTTPSFTVTLQGSYDGTNWFTVATHTALTANGNNTAQVSEEQGTTVSVIPPLLRSSVVVSGTTPTAVLTHIVYAED